MGPLEKFKIVGPGPDFFLFFLNVKPECIFIYAVQHVWARLQEIGPGLCLYVTSWGQISRKAAGTMRVPTTCWGQTSKEGAETMLVHVGARLQERGPGCTCISRYM